MSTPGVINRLDAERIEQLMDVRFPQIHAGGRTLLIEEVSPGGARVRMKHHERNTRPGGTMAGSSMFTLADFGVYVAIIGVLGERGIDAVTSNLNINFLAKPAPHDLIAHMRLLRLGRRTAVGEALIYSEGDPEMVAHAIASYALPIQFTAVT